MALWVLGAVMVLLIVCPAVSFGLSPLGGRVYEQVSPLQKSGGIGGVLPLGPLTASGGQPLQGAANGAGIAYLGEDFYQPRLGGLDEYLSQRSSTGWSTKNLTLGVPSTNEISAGANLYVGFSPDLSAGIFDSTINLTKNAPSGYANLYLTRNTSVQPLLTVTPPNRALNRFGYAYLNGISLESGIERQLLFAGGNAGTAVVEPFSHVLFEANDALTPDAKDGGEYENNLYEWVDGELTLVNVLPDGEAAPNASFGVSHNDSYVNVPLPSLDHVISADGSRVIWTDENNGNLYMRENGTSTIQIDEAVGGQGSFQTASLNGSKVFFTKAGHLYEYDVPGKVTRDLTGGGGVLGVLGGSDDGNYIYLVSTSILAGEAVAGQPNLYVSHEGELGFVATLAFEDDRTRELEIYGSGATPEGDWYQTYAGRTAEVSPNGRYVAFLSKRALTGYDNLDEGNPFFEIFVDDCNAMTLACASCNTDGSPPTHKTLLPISSNGVYQQRYLDNAGRLFYSTAEAVVPADTNDASDVYEYAEGQISLISPAGDGDEAVFADASESGADVFFTTRQQLVPGDRDQVIDLYDARVDGTLEEPLPTACMGEGCRHGLSASLPSLGAPASIIFVGPGNLGPSTAKPPMSVKRVLHKKTTKKHHRTHKKPVKKRGKRSRNRARR